MKAFTVITIIVLVLLVGGGVTAGLIVASEQAPSEPTPQAVIPLADHPQVDAPVETVRSMQSSVAVQQSEVETPKPPLDTGLKAGRLAPVQAQAEPSQLVPQMGDASGEVETQGTVYTWQDGDKARRAVLQTHRVVRETVADAAEDGAIKTAADATEDGAIKKEELDSIVREESQHGSDDEPVFRSESGGGLMTLPGGVILALDPELDQAAVENFFSRNGIPLERTSELDFLDNGFFVETEPGFPSLELANALAVQEGVILSSPNWAREVESR